MESRLMKLEKYGKIISIILILNTLQYFQLIVLMVLISVKVALLSRKTFRPVPPLIKQMKIVCSQSLFNLKQKFCQFRLSHSKNYELQIFDPLAEWQFLNLYTERSFGSNLFRRSTAVMRSIQKNLIWKQFKKYFLLLAVYSNKTDLIRSSSTTLFVHMLHIFVFKSNENVADILLRV